MDSINYSLKYQTKEDITNCYQYMNQNPKFWDYITKDFLDQNSDQKYLKFVELTILQKQVKQAINQGIALTELQRYTESLSSYDKTIFLNPNYIPAYYNKGIVLQQIKNNKVQIFQKRAMKQQIVLIKLFQLNQIMPNPIQIKAMAYLKYLQKTIKYKLYSLYNKKLKVNLCDLGQFNEALYNYDKAISINSQFIEAYYNKGILLDDLKKFEEAIKCYDEVIKLDPNDSQSYYNKAISLKIILDNYLFYKIQRKMMKLQNVMIRRFNQICHMLMLTIIKVYCQNIQIIFFSIEKLGKKKLAIQNYKTAMKKCSIDQNIFSKRIKRLKNKQ